MAEAGHLKRVASRHLKPLVPGRYHFRAAGDGSDIVRSVEGRVTTGRLMPVEPKTMILMKSASSYSFYPR